MPIGTVKFFNAGKGFGFITPDGGAKDVFVPSASMASSGVTILKPGQRISFEEVPDAKGPKAVNLKLLEAPPKPVAAPRPPKPEISNHVTLYCDPSHEEAEDILFGLRDAGLEPVLVDYMATPPTRDQLKALASLLRGTEQNLVRRYDHMFAELRLDDRFISENDYWDAVVEHPSLINGPVVTLGGRAAVCHSFESLKAFLAPPSADANGARPKGLSPALLRLMAGHAPEPRQEPKPEVERVEVKRVPEPEPAPVMAKVEIKVRPKVAVVAEKVLAKPKAAAKPEAKAKPAPKPKAPAKKSAAKPVKKTKR